METEVAFLVGDGQPAGAGLEKARAIQAFSAGQVEGCLDAIAALGGAGGRGGVVERGDRRGISGAEALDVLGSGCAAAMSASLRATASRSNDSSSSSVVVEPLLPPSWLVIETETFRTMPAV